MYKTKEVFSKYASDVSQLQYLNFYPTSTLNLNDENKKTKFKIDLDDDFISKNIQYYIQGEFTPKDSTKSYAAGNGARMIDNFVAHLFSQIEVRKHGTLIDDIEFPGIASTIKGCSEYPGINVFNGKAINSGFETHSIYETKQIEAVGKLSDLGLGFFNDINIPIYKGNFEIIFTRNSDDNVIYRFKVGNTDYPIEGKFKITTFYLRVPVIEYNSEAKHNLAAELIKNNYFFEFKKWQCIQHVKVTGKTLTIDITNLYKSIINPIWAFVVFQTNRLNNQIKDNSRFDHSSVKDYWIELGKNRYPKELLDLNFDDNYYGLAYDAFQDFKKIYIKTDSLPYVDKKGFKSDYPIFSIDLRYQPESVSNTKNNIVLHVEFNKTIEPPTGNDEGTTCYIVLLSKSVLRYDPFKSKISEEF
jgi:hypothetical protein